MKSLDVYAQWLLCCIWTCNHNIKAVYVLCNKLIITILPFIPILNALFSKGDKKNNIRQFVCTRNSIYRPEYAFNLYRY